MRTTRIELEGTTGSVAIERKKNSHTIRIDSMLREPNGQQAWLTWQIPPDTDEEELFKIASTVQHRCDGTPGNNSMIHDYYRELQRFTD